MKGGKLINIVVENRAIKDTVVTHVKLTLETLGLDTKA